MQFLRTNTAVIVTVGPFFDATDGVTIETGLTITNERITLTADTDAGSAPTIILDNVTGATSGTANDLNYITNGDNGMMQIELAAANVNRLGRMRLTITDGANHVPVFEDFLVLPAMIYDSFILGTDRFDTNVTHTADTAWVSSSIACSSIANDAITDAAIATGAIASTAFAAGAIDAAAIAADAIGASELAAGAVDEILDDTIGDGTLTVRQALRIIVAACAGKLSGAATTTVTIRNTADTADRIVATVDTSGNRSAVTITP